MNKKKMIIAAAVLAAAAVSLCGCKKNAEKQPETAPEMYDIAGETVKGFPAGEGVEFAEEIPETSENADAASSDAASDDVKVYHYQNVADTLKAVSDYCASLTEGEDGFIPVDYKNKEKELPSFDQESGSVKLARSVSEKELVIMDISWESNAVSVSVSKCAGEIEREPERMTLQECIDYVEQLSPSALGLAGDSMDKYQVIALDGSVRVNGIPCLRINVYWFNQQTESNEIAGMFLFNPTNKEIYQVDLNKNIIPVQTEPAE